MTAVSNSVLRELDHRAADGIDVTLMWGGANRVVVLVTDERTGDAFALAPAPERALDAFRHPFAYASA